MAQSESNKSLSMFDGLTQIKTTLEAISQAEEMGHGMLVDQLIGDFYAILKDSEGGVDRCVGFVKYVDKEVEAIDEEVARLTALKKSKERASERVKQLALAFMDTAGMKTLEGQYGRKFTKVESKSVIITALDKIPDSLKRVTTVIEPDKKAIASYILEHGKCAGATLAPSCHVRVR